MSTTASANSNHKGDQQLPTPLGVGGRWDIFVLLVSVSIIAVCGIIYELIIGTISSYLLGNSVYQFSITIGLFMSSMGLGSYISQWFARDLIDRFIVVEILIGLIGGVSAAALFFAYSNTNSDFAYFSVMFILIAAIGALVGIEIPILTRIMRQYESLRVTIANVLAFDYLGALVGSVAFPILLLRYLGLIETAFVIGSLNAFVAVIVITQYRAAVRSPKLLSASALFVGAALIVGAVYANNIDRWIEQHLYQSRIVLSKQTKYQKVVITYRSPDDDYRRENEALGQEDEPPKIAVATYGDDLRLFINGNIQFCSVDEYRYHEALVHPAMSLAEGVEDVLVLGGGDGLATREILKYPQVKSIVLVDLDPDIVEICRTHPRIVELNKGAFDNPRVYIINEDAYKFVEETGMTFGVIISDLPDPEIPSLSKLYSKEFYSLLMRALKPDGVFVTQSASPYFAQKAFWCIHQTIEAAGFTVVPYHLNVPSFGDWGFNLATIGSEPKMNEIKLKVETRFLDEDYMGAMLKFGKDTAEVETKVNTLIRPVLMSYYDDDRWRAY